MPFFELVTCRGKRSAHVGDRVEPRLGYCTSHDVDPGYTIALQNHQEYIRLEYVYYCYYYYYYYYDSYCHWVFIEVLLMLISFTTAAGARTVRAFWCFVAEALLAAYALSTVDLHGLAMAVVGLAATILPTCAPRALR